MIEIIDLGGEECKLRKICRKIKNNGKLNNIQVHNNVYDEHINYNFYVLIMPKYKRYIHVIPYTVSFWGSLNKETYVMTIGNVNEELFDRVYAASKLLFEDIDDLTVRIEKDYC